MIEEKTNNEVKKLLKNDKKEIVYPNRGINLSKRKIEAICRSLSWPSNNYRADRTFRSIYNYLTGKHKLERILYSVISSHIFDLSLKDRATFLTNVDNLLQYAMSEDCEAEFSNYDNAALEDCKKVIIKIYDHSQLAAYQIENAKKIIGDNIGEVEEGLRKQNKGIEREYITILAIFASLVVTFIGGVSFSGEILKNMNNVSIYRLLLVIDGIAFILMNLVHMMIKLIFRINGMNDDFYDIHLLNFIFAVAAVLIVVYKIS